MDRMAHHKNYSQAADRSTFKHPKHGQVRILPNPRAPLGVLGNATSTASVATALFGNTTAGGYYRYNPGNRDEDVSANNTNAQCILPESRSVQTPTTSSPHAAEGRHFRPFANGQPQILKRAICFDAEKPQQLSGNPATRPTSWAQAHEPKCYGDIRRGRGRGGHRGRGRGNRVANESSRSHQGSSSWRVTLCVNTPNGKQKAQGDESSGWSMSGIPLNQWTSGLQEDNDFLPTRQGFLRVVAWLDASDERNVEGVSSNESDNENSLETSGEELRALSALNLRSRPATPENGLNTGGQTTAARRRRVQRALRGQIEPQILDAGSVKSMEMVYEEARRKMAFVGAEDEW